MTDLKISQLPAASSLTGNELTPIVQDGVNKTATSAQIAALAGGGSSDPVNLATGVTGVLSIANGGTGATSAAAARAALGITSTGGVDTLALTYFGGA